MESIEGLFEIGTYFDYFGVAMLEIMKTIF